MRILRHPLFWTFVGVVVGLPGLLDDIQVWKQWLTMEGWERWDYFSVATGAMIIILAWRSRVERWLATIPIFSGLEPKEDTDNALVQQLRDQISQQQELIDSLREDASKKAKEEETIEPETVETVDVERVTRTPKQLVEMVSGKTSLEADRLTEPFIGMGMTLSVRVEDVFDFVIKYVIEAHSSDGISLKLESEKTAEERNPIFERLAKGDLISLKGRIKAIGPRTLILNKCKIL